MIRVAGTTIPFYRYLRVVDASALSEPIELASSGRVHRQETGIAVLTATDRDPVEVVFTSHDDQCFNDLKHAVGDREVCLSVTFRGSLVGVANFNGFVPGLQLSLPRSDGSYAATVKFTGEGEGAAAGEPFVERIYVDLYPEDQA